MTKEERDELDALVQEFVDAECKCDDKRARIHRRESDKALLAFAGKFRAFVQKVSSDLLVEVVGEQVVEHAPVPFLVEGEPQFAADGSPILVARESTIEPVFGGRKPSWRKGSEA